MSSTEMFSKEKAIISSTEILVLVDDQNREIGQEEKISVHKSGKLHRAFSIFIFRKSNERTELLLQQRNINKYHCGNLWTNSCCGHPRVGEDLIAAGERRLYEEMLFTTKLFSIDTFCYRADCKNGLIEHELDHVLVGCYQEEILQVNAQEVQDFRWLAMAEVAQELQQFPNCFTPWFEQALQLVKKHIAEIDSLLFNANNRKTEQL